MTYIAIALTLLSLVAGIHLLWKTKADAMGNFSTWIAYAVIIISIGMLLCELGQTSLRIIRHDHFEGMHGPHMGMMQYCPPEMCNGVPCMIPMRRGNMDCCGMGMRNSCRGMGDKSDMDHGRGGMKDKCCEDMEGHQGMKSDSMKMGH